MTTLTQKWKAFIEWQQRPYTVAPMSEDQHRCHTCGTEYQGNYCPRCGQSANIGRYSMKGAVLLFIDVWGLGNRGMFRTLRDLLLRPGYMIRDYLAGMQHAYFPPFKLFFLLTALSLVVEGGFNIQGENYFEISRQQISQTQLEPEKDLPPEMQQEMRRFNARIEKLTTDFTEFVFRYPNIFSLGMLLLASGLLYLFFRRSPNIPDLRYSELLVALVYSSDMFTLVTTIAEFFCMSLTIQTALMLLPVVPMKQLSGYSWWKTTLFFLITASVLFLFFLAALLFFALAT